MAMAGGGGQDLGIHTEMFSDGILPLIENGNINNAKKVGGREGPPYWHRAGLAG